MSVDILPTQIPQDASTHFSKALMPYLRTLIRQYQGNLASDDQDRVTALNRATIAQQGALIGKQKWLATPLRDFRQKQKRASEATHCSTPLQAQVPAGDKDKPVGIAPKKKVLLLGTGMVARPAVEEFSKRNDVILVVGNSILQSLLI